MIIKAKIDVTKIEKARLYVGKTGRKYLDITLLENRDGADQYGNNFMIVQDVSKEDREAGIKGPILGNAKILEKRNESAPAAQQPATTSPIDNDDVPF